MPATTIREVIEQMDALLARWESRGDFRAVFLRSYRIITIGIEQAISAGEFEDPVWMERLDVLFAQEYFDAVEAYERGDPQTPGSWTLALDLSSQKRSTALQDLTLGMVAHIVNDLPIALFKAGIAAPHRASRQRDHETSNDVLGRLIDDVQREISSHYSLVLGFLDRLTGDKDEILTDTGIRATRDEAWNQAVALTDAVDEMERAEIRRRLEEVSTGATQLLAPKPPTFLARLIPPFRRWDRALARWFRRV